MSGISSKIDEANIINSKRVSKKVIPDDKPKTSVKKLQLRESTVETERLSGITSETANSRRFTFFR